MSYIYNHQYAFGDDPENNRSIGDSIYLDILNDDRYIAWTEDRVTSDTAERIFCCLGTATGHVTTFSPAKFSDPVPRDGILGYGLSTFSVVDGSVQFIYLVENVKSELSGSITK